MSDVFFKALRARRDAEAHEARLQVNEVKSKAETALTVEASPTPEAEPCNSVDQLDIFEDETAAEDGGLFGHMLDEPEASTSEVEPLSTATTIAIRSMPIPKQYSFAGNVPKSLLRANLAKSSKQAVITYARLSGPSRAVRAGLEIRWSPTRRRVWRMDDIACESMVEAEHYVSTLALNELSGTGELSGLNWRTMPPEYRDLWEDLDVARKAKEDCGKREVWARIQEVLDQKTIKDAALDGPSTTRIAASLPLENGSAARSHGGEFHQYLQSDFQRRQASNAYQRMLRHRDTLPIASFRRKIIETLEASQVMVLSGETGCGKSTQLPSFILEEQLSKGRSCKIFVTEPRRISAISLAQRVSQELGDSPGAMGTNSSFVGYSIRLDAKVSASTRLAFVTNGIALRMLESGSSGNSKGTAFDEVTHIIVDEVHERSIDSDFLLIVLKSLIQHRKDLKVVLMSATVDAEKISQFFGGCPFLSVPGRTFPVHVNYLEDAVELAGWHIDASSPLAIPATTSGERVRQLKALQGVENGAKADDEDDSDLESSADPTKLSAVRYSARTVTTVNLLDYRHILYDLITKLLEKICFEESELLPFSQAVLIFMPGLAEIRRMNDVLQEHPSFGNEDFVIYPLHSTISTEGQSAVFDQPGPGRRKIVICEPRLPSFAEA